jgi:hypothetical protein
MGVAFLLLISDVQNSNIGQETTRYPEIFYSFLQLQAMLCSNSEKTVTVYFNIISTS